MIEPQQRVDSDLPERQLVSLNLQQDGNRFLQHRVVGTEVIAETAGLILTERVARGTFVTEFTSWFVCCG